MIETKNTQDQILLKGILAADPKSLQQVYNDILPSVIYWVKENRGSESDARDIFQEAMIALFRKLEGGSFKLTCTLKSYLRVCCRNLWLTRLRDNKKFDATPIEDSESVHLDDEMTTRLEHSEKEQLFFKHFDQLGENCKRIMQWFFDKVSLKEIATRLNTSENYIKKRKFICKEKLVKAVQADPRFRELRS